MYVFDGGRLAELRKAAGLTQDDLAQALETSQQSIGRWENGKSEPGLGHLFALADMYGVTLDELVDRRADKAVSPALTLNFHGDEGSGPAQVVTLDERAKIETAMRRLAAAARTLNGIFPSEPE